MRRDEADFIISSTGSEKPIAGRRERLDRGSIDGAHGQPRRARWSGVRCHGAGADGRAGTAALLVDANFDIAPSARTQQRDCLSMRGRCSCACCRASNPPAHSSRASRICSGRLRSRRITDPCTSMIANASLRALDAALFAAISPAPSESRRARPHQLAGGREFQCGTKRSIAGTCGPRVRAAGIEQIVLDEIRRRKQPRWWGLPEPHRRPHRAGDGMRRDRTRDMRTEDRHSAPTPPLRIHLQAADIDDAALRL